eukprot:TRINITY_DN20401_c0_g1_i1.p2 TRINITY_DN20401_c0_g1~~TRINITY_DN20401_c0_g1_i1.p2  ORF type:complete len:202 (-),score=13.07 TRINITY_DN20401_c0_g1_i1:25-630(-)
MSSSQQKVLIQIRNMVRQCITQLKKMRSCWEVQGIQGLQQLQNICDFQIKQKSVREISPQLSQFFYLKTPIVEQYWEKIKEEFMELQISLLKIQASLEEFQKSFQYLQQQLDAYEEFKKYAVFKKVSTQTFVEFLGIINNQYSEEVENKMVIVNQIDELILQSKQMKRDEMQVLIWTWMMQPMLNDKEIGCLLQIMQNELI